MRDEGWSRLRFYESTEVLKEFAQKCLGFSMGAGQAEDIRACLCQGREYFGSARDAGLTVRPLLLYYGMLALAKAVTLVRGGGESRRLCCLPHSHGLQANDLGGCIEEASCEIQEAGTFQRFNNAILLNDAVSIYPHRLCRRNATAEDLKGKSLRLRELWRFVPELATSYLWTFDSDVVVVPVHLEGTGSGWRLRIDDTMRDDLRKDAAKCLTPTGRAVYLDPGEVDVEALTAATLPFECLDSHVDWPADTPAAAVEEGWEPPVAASVLLPTAEVPPIAPLSTLLLAMFILGSVARYSPDAWVRLVLLGQDDRPLSYTLEFLDYCEAAFPQRIANVMFPQRHVPARLGRV